MHLLCLLDDNGLFSITDFPYNDNYEIDDGNDDVCIFRKTTQRNGNMRLRRLCHLNIFLPLMPLMKGARHQVQ